MSACYLMDTHTLLWATGNPKRLSDKTYDLINDPECRIFISHASIWELSIKWAIGKIDLPRDFFDAIPRSGYEILSLDENAFTAYRQLPLLHRDPFDRILVAQAQCENLALLSKDTDIAQYDVKCIW